VLGFAMGPYGCMERTWKPFNPILGETFELDMDKGVRFFAEQVRNDCYMHWWMTCVQGHDRRHI
jgi:Oxysterol-binding protein